MLYLTIGKPPYRYARIVVTPPGNTARHKPMIDVSISLSRRKQALQTKSKRKARTTQQAHAHLIARMFVSVAHRTNFGYQHHGPLPQSPEEKCSLVRARTFVTSANICAWSRSRFNPRPRLRFQIRRISQDGRIGDDGAHAAGAAWRDDAVRSVDSSSQE